MLEVFEKGFKPKQNKSRFLLKSHMFRFLADSEVSGMKVELYTKNVWDPPSEPSQFIPNASKTVKTTVK